MADEKTLIERVRKGETRWIDVLTPHTACMLQVAHRKIVLTGAIPAVPVAGSGIAAATRFPAEVVPDTDVGPTPSAVVVVTASERFAPAAGGGGDTVVPVPLVDAAGELRQLVAAEDWTPLVRRRSRIGVGVLGSSFVACCRAHRYQSLGIRYMSK
jgi:hypothetical protein